MGVSPTRPGRPSLLADPLSRHVAKDQHYTTGTADPKLHRDPGAGVWNSTGRTAAAVSQYAALTAVLPLAAFYPGRNAAKHLLHYMKNSGRAYTIDLEDMIDDVPIARRAMVAEFRQAQRFIQTLPIGRHLFTSLRGESAYNYKSESADWFFAIGGYTYWGKGEARVLPSKAGKRFMVDFEFCFFDRYNWDGGKSVEIGGVTVTDHFMGEFHRQGLAREFDCFGSVRRSLEWDGVGNVPEDRTILRQSGR